MTQSSPSSPDSPARPAPGPLAVAVLSGLLLLVVGWFYLVSGLIAPLWAVVALLVWWVVLAWWLVRLARRGSWLTPLVPVVGAATWFVVMTLGDQLLGWTA